MRSTKNVDPDKYCYMDLMNDVYQLSLSHISSKVGLDITYTYFVLGTNETLAIAEDNDLMKMLDLNKNHKYIHLYV